MTAQLSIYLLHAEKATKLMPLRKTLAFFDSRAMDTAESKLNEEGWATEYDIVPACNGMEVSHLTTVGGQFMKVVDFEAVMMDPKDLKGFQGNPASKTPPKDIS